MYMGESFKTILEEYEIDPINYSEVMSSVSAHLWQGVMEVELEPMHSNKIWELVKAPNMKRPS